MSLIQCTCSCLYQKDGYCRLEKAAQITSLSNHEGCLHFLSREKKPVPTEYKDSIQQ